MSAPKRKDTMTVANQKFSLLHHFNEKTKEKKYSRDIDTIQEQKTSSFLPSQAKALFNFEPKTEIGKQLC